IQSDNGYPVIGSGGQFAFAKDFMFDGEVVFLGRKGTIDKPLYFKGKFWAVDTMFYANGKNGNNVKFHYYISTQIPFKLYSTSTALPSMTQSDLKEHYFACPSIQEQTAIARFLDYKLAKINRFIQKKKQLIKLLNEQKAAIINQAVTKGLDPNAKMKDSGIEWLGEIPEHWEVIKNKYLNEINMGQSPSSDDYNFEGKGKPFLQGNAEFGYLNPSPKTWCENANKVCSKNDILLSVRAPIGAVNIADQEYGIGRGLSSISCKSNLMFWFYQFLTLKERLNSIGTGSTYFAISID